MIRLLALLLLALPNVAQAVCGGTSPNLTAASAASTDVSDCLTAAVNGDTITVPAGSATWTTGITITKYVKLIASGTVTITDNTPSTANMISITESTCPNCNTRLQGFIINQGTGHHDNPNGVLVLSSTTGGRPILVTGNTYNTLAGNTADFIIANVNRGVIWDNTMNGTVAGGPFCYNQQSFVRHKLTGAGSSWTTATVWGSADTNGDQNLYIEHNTLNTVLQGIDVDDNARAVVRDNTFNKSAILTHGVDTSGQYGGRSMEVYNNTWVDDGAVISSCTSCGSSTPLNQNGRVTFRGGTGVIHDNVIPAIPNNGCWGVKTEVQFPGEPLRRNSGGFACWNSITAPGAGYPFPHQPGWGYTTGGTTLNGSSCPNCPVRQDSEPIYLWNNTGTGNYAAPAVQDYACGQGDSCPSCSSLASAATYIVSGRDYFTGTARPGYTPYTYPHPLTGGSPPSTTTTTIAPGATIPGGATLR